MAFARCKILCIKRSEEHVCWWVDKRTGQVCAPTAEGAELRLGLASPPEPNFPKGKCNREFRFAGAYPQSGVDENARFWEATPSLDFTLRIANAAVDFVPGKYYYMDFVRGGLD